MNSTKLHPGDLFCLRYPATFMRDDGIWVLLDPGILCIFVRLDAKASLDKTHVFVFVRDGGSLTLCRGSSSVEWRFKIKIICRADAHGQRQLP